MPTPIKNEIVLYSDAASSILNREAAKKPYVYKLECGKFGQADISDMYVFQ